MMIGDTRGAQALGSLRLRGGAAIDVAEQVDEEDASAEEEPPEPLPYDQDTALWLVDQLCLYQTSVSLISEKLAVKGYKVRDMIPKPPGLMCTQNSEEHPVPCRIYMDAAPKAKLVAPCKCKGSQRWISVQALNDLRRREPEKWSKCPTCQTKIDYAKLESHMDKMSRLPTVLLNNRKEARAVLAAAVGLVLWTFSHWIRVAVIRVLVSGVFWRQYHITHRLIHLPLPLKILLGRWIMKASRAKFLRVEGDLRSRLAALESEHLEKALPITVDAKDIEQEAF